MWLDQSCSNEKGREIPANGYSNSNVNGPQVHCSMVSEDGVEMRALASRQCGLGSIPVRDHMWVEFVVGSRLVPKVFPPGTPVFDRFFPLVKPAFPYS